MRSPSPRPSDLRRQAIRVRGLVQGVGFRPFVYRLATESRLTGSVRNDVDGVFIEVQGPASALERFVERLSAEAPPLARIDRVETRAQPAQAAAEGFRIEASRGGQVNTGIVPDAAVCRECLAELFDPANRRYRYAFINCTHCGPRYTITRALPYDRPQTSMARFAQCPACLAEYEAPLDRRFHAQPNACPACGPRLALAGPDGAPMPGGADPAATGVQDVVARALALLRAGRIVALKGLGGFHLVCDARHADAVARLRRLKQRDAKPFAAMVASTASCAGLASPTPDERRLLESAARPIVLMPRAAGAEAALPGVADGMPGLGLMLPYTPLQYLLFHEAAGRPAGLAWLDAPQTLALVMTSANPGGEPLVIGNDEAFARLRGIADAFVVHDRDILVRCDDSVARVIVPADGPRPQFVRRARGWTPAAIRLPRSGRSVLATGGFLKNTVCLTRGDEAFLSQHIGDLDNAASCVALEEAVEHLQRVLEIEPEAVAHDLHPDFFSSRFAAAWAAERGLPRFAIQHHHAHVAAVLAEHGAAGGDADAPVLGLALDGVGLGADQGIWGGELLRVEAGTFERLGHLRTLPLPGGDRAAREPWRCAAAALHLLGRGDEIERRWPGAAAAAVRGLLESGRHAPPTSSMGRWFDAAAGLLGVARNAAFEGHAAMMLEGLAARHGEAAALADAWSVSRDGLLDLTPLLALLAEETDAARGAACFHATLAAALADWSLAAARARKLDTIALGGGCFLNAILGRGLRTRLAAAGLRVLEAQQAPPNDGGLALGQAWAAQQRLQSDTTMEPVPCASPFPHA